MKTQYILYFIFGILLFTACQREEDELDPADFPVDGEVFIDGFSSGLEYSAFAGSDVTGFDVDYDTKYKGDAAMAFAVPDDQSATGSYVGGAFFTAVGRDLSSFNVLTFWAKASKAANIDEIGFGNDLGENKYITKINNVPVTTNWQKYYIPIPNPAVLTQERGMLFYSEAPENGRGYTFWLDEVQFENLGTIIPLQPQIQNGQDQIESAETGDQFTIEPTARFNIPTGIEQTVNGAPAYFNYSSSHPDIASVDANGIVTVMEAGNASITASLGEQECEGSLIINSTGDPILPSLSAPSPPQDASAVISLFSDSYEDAPVDFYNGFWEFSTTQSKIFPLDNNDQVLRYSALNFVGIQFTAPTVDASAMTHMHIDIWTPEVIAEGAELKILVVDIGADGSFGGNDDSSHELTFTHTTLQSEEWTSIDIPFTELPGLSNRAHLAQVVLSGNISTLFMDNLYFYREDQNMGSSVPESAAPTPSIPAEQVISVYSDAYDDIAGTDLNPDWGQATVVSQTAIEGNNTLLYQGLNYQGTQLGSAQDLTEMEFLHLDIYSSNSSICNVFLISSGPVETAYALPVPTDGWISVDIPLAEFAPVDMGDVIQLKFDGNGDIYLDNIYFYQGGVPTEPASPAPAPELAQEQVISLFSDSYEDRPVDTWRTDWSNADFEDTTVEGNAIKKYSNLDFVGIETVSQPIDASQMTHFHIDVWSADYEFIGIKLVDFGADGAFGGGDDVEHQINIESPQKAAWISYDLPLSDFTGLTTRTNIAQYIIVGQPTGATTLFVDNVYFHN